MKLLYGGVKKDNCYIIDVLELPVCMADGEILAELTVVIEEAIKLWIEIKKEVFFA